MQKFKKDDEVIVTAGRDKGKRGTILQVIEPDRLLVSGVNNVKKAVRPNPQANPPVQGGIVTKEATIHRSNVALYNEETGKADRVGVRVEDGKRVRYFKSTNKVVGE